MTFRHDAIARFVYAYLAAPTLIFMLGWLRWELGVPAALSVLVALWSVFRRRGCDETLVPLAEPDGELRVSVPVAITLALCVVVWCILAGQGGFVLQTSDWNWRNATFRDLITHDWPVRYDSWNRALVFYVGHWLPSALVGKLAFAATDSLPWAWRIGNLALLAWTAAGVMLALAQLLLLLRARSVRRQFAVLLLLVFWGGLDAVGAITMNVRQMVAGFPPELTWWNVSDWWMSMMFNYTSNSTCLFWVFHQAVSAWVAILFFARGARLSESAFLVSLLPICGPFPAIGIAFAVCVLGLNRVCSSAGGFLRVLRASVSLPNLIGVFVVAPLVAAFICCNPAAGRFSFAWMETYAVFSFTRWLLFFGCELGLYFAFTFGPCRRNPWWWGAVFWLFVCPLIAVDGEPDFGMRTSIPWMVALSSLVFYSVTHVGGIRNWRGAVLVVCIAVGTYVPVKEMFRTLYNISQAGLGVVASEDLPHIGYGIVASDRIVTFDQDLEARFSGEFGPGAGDWITSKCNVKSPDELFFFRHLARKRKGN